MSLGEYRRNDIFANKDLLIMAIDQTKQYTYADYLTWTDGKRFELINGRVVEFPATLSEEHQRISANILTQIAILFLGKKDRCRLYHAPFDVRLPLYTETNDNSILNVLKPDIVVVCDKNKIDRRGCLGAPDLIVEVITPRTARYDLNDKFELYQMAGVKEYWVVFPNDKALISFQLMDNGKFDAGTVHTAENKIHSNLFESFEVDLWNVFENND